MKHFSSLIGAAICGALVFSVWPEMWKTYGIIGGWLTAAIVISITWYMNHWVGVIDNPAGKLWVDQAWAVGTAGIAWALVRFQGDFTAFKSCLPTLTLCLIGGALAGLAASQVRKQLNRASEKDAPTPNATPNPAVKKHQYAEMAKHL